MALGRLNRPGLMIYGGTIKPGKSCLTGKPLNIESAALTFSEFSAGFINEEERYDIVSNSCPGPGNPPPAGDSPIKVASPFQGLAGACIRQTPCQPP